MPTSSHLVIGTDHPFAAALMVSLCRTYGEATVRTMNDAAELSSVSSSLPIESLYLLSGIFPVAAEHPTATWHRSVRQLVSVLDFAKSRPVKVFWPSSIAVFGTSAPAEQCPVEAPQETGSFYAISKRAGEQWCRQYHEEHGVDVRCLRFPVLIRRAAASIPEPAPKIVTDQRRPVLHVEDAVRATLELMFAPPEAIRQRIYQVSGTSISVAELLTEIRVHRAAAGIEIWNLPELAGPASLDDSAARADWGWKPRYDLLRLVKSLLQTR